MAGGVATQEELGVGCKGEVAGGVATQEELGVGCKLSRFMQKRMVNVENEGMIIDGWMLCICDQ